MAMRMVKMEKGELSIIVLLSDSKCLPLT